MAAEIFVPTENRDTKPDIFVPIEGEIVENFHPAAQEMPPKKRLNVLLLLVYIFLTTLGTIGGPLPQRLYFTHGGSLKWLQTWLGSIGFVAALPVISVLLLKKGAFKNLASNEAVMDLKLSMFACAVGVLTGLMNYMFSNGFAYIPVSTSSILSGTQLAFCAVFAFFIVRQKFTFYTFNSIVLMTLAAVVLALGSSSDRPPGVSQGRYLLGFFMTLGGAVVAGLIAPLVELGYNKSSRSITLLLVLQFQAVMNAFAALFATVGMLVNNEFRAISKEAGEFDMGTTKYYTILVSSAIIWQLATIGAMGVISCTSGLFTGILSAVLYPLTQIAAVIAFQENYSGEKGLSLALSLWGFVSYFRGEYKKTRKQTKPVVDHVNGFEDSRETDLE